MDSSASGKDLVVDPCDRTSWMHERWQANLSASLVTIDVSSVLLGNGNVYTTLYLLQWYKLPQSPTHNTVNETASLGKNMAHTKYH